MGRLHDGKDRQSEGLVSGPAHACPRRLFGGDPADDRGQLLRPGHVRQQRVLLGRSRMVRRDAAQRPDVERARAPDHLLGDHPRHRGAAWHHCGSEHAEKRLLGFRLPCADGAAAPHPVERRRHHLADFRPRRHRPSRPHARSHRH